jgi:hypothetical protein
MRSTGYFGALSHWAETDLPLKPVRDTSETFETWEKTATTDSGRPGMKTGGDSALLSFSFVDFACCLFACLPAARPLCSAAFQATLLCRYLIQCFSCVCSCSFRALFMTYILLAVERLVVLHRPAQICLRDTVSRALPDEGLYGSAAFPAFGLPRLLLVTVALNDKLDRNL